MHKRMIQKRLKKISVFFGVVSLLLLIGVGFLSLFLSDIQENNQIVTIARITVIVVLVLAAFLILYGYGQLKRSNEQLIQATYYDSVTGAYNRRWFTQAIERLEGWEGGYSIVAMNVRKFKFINEIFGRENADRLLCQIKMSIEKYLLVEEYYCRDAADTFLICFKETDKERIRERLQTMMNEISRKQLDFCNNYQVLLYCGVTVAEETTEKQNSEKVLTHAMFALEKAKGTHWNNIWFYDVEFHKKEQLENYIESHMRQALRNHEFQPFLQPKMNMKNGSLGGAEVLVRWLTTEGTVLYPDEFIPLFEENRFCVHLDMYMAECVCRQIQKWMNGGIEPIPLSVNQTKLLFYEDDYVQNLCNLIDKYGIPANLITLEILEGLELENVEEINNKIVQLKAKGFKIAMDDFGSGYSSLNILGNLNIDELKLDRAFLLKEVSGQNQRQHIIMEQIVELTKKLQISTVAEGVDTLENERLIKEIGCDFGQGYYYGKPVSTLEFDEIYMKSRRISGKGNV